MSYYYKYDFVSPEPVYALVKEELKSYFDTGAIDDTLFPVYTNKCLKKLGRGSFKINEKLLYISDFQARLPEDFLSVREAWLCTNITQAYQLPTAQYDQITQTSTRLDSPDVYCSPCTSCETPDIIQAIYKTTNTVLFQTRKKYLLTPGNISVKSNCSLDCANLNVSSPESFDIRDNKFVVNFREGTVYLIYYSEERDEKGYQLIPDNVRIAEYIESYIKYKMFEQLSNQATDETFNQMQTKKESYNAEQFEKQVLAEIEIKKQTVWQKRHAALKSIHRNDRFKIF